MMHNIFFKFTLTIRKSLYITFFLFDLLLHRKNKLIILCYHSVTKDNWRYSIDPEMIKKQLLYIKKNYNLITIKDVLDIIAGFKRNTYPAALITFDDGYKDILTLREFFTKENITPTIFILSDTERANRKEIDSMNSFLSHDEIQSLIKVGWTVGCHSATHADFWDLTSTSVEQEVIYSKQKLERQLRIPIHYFAYPKGRYTKEIVKSVQKAGYLLGLSMNDGFISNKTNPFLVPRIGIDRTHSFVEFKSSISPTTVLFRKFVKESKIGQLL